MYPLRWVRRIQAQSGATRRWKVLLDAAAFLPCHPLNLTDTPANFVAISFYKARGLGTGCACAVGPAVHGAVCRHLSARRSCCPHSIAAQQRLATTGCTMPLFPPALHVQLFGYPTGVGAWVARREDVAAAK